MRAPHLLLALSLSVAAGCVGAINDPGPGMEVPDAAPVAGKMGPTLYKTTVHPILQKCGGSTCHATTATGAALGKFYTADAGASYTAIVGAASIVGTFKASSPILTKIAPGTHFATYAGTEASTITAWLAAETEDRKNDVPVMPADPLAAIKQWSGCMQLADFQTANMAIAWGTMAGTNPNKSCVNCHGGGLNGFIATTDETSFFGGITTQSGLLRAYFATDANAAVIINTGSFVRVGAPNSAVINHPHFDTANNPGMTALQMFYTLTKAHLADGTCGPSKLTDI